MRDLTERCCLVTLLTACCSCMDCKLCSLGLETDKTDLFPMSHVVVINISCSVLTLTNVELWRWAGDGVQCLPLCTCRSLALSEWIQVRSGCSDCRCMCLCVCLSVCLSVCLYVCVCAWCVVGVWSLSLLSSGAWLSLCLWWTYHRSNVHRYLRHSRCQGKPFLRCLKTLRSRWFICCSQETSDSRLSYAENPESLSHLGLNWYRVVTDRQTDGRTELQ